MLIVRVIPLEVRLLSIPIFLKKSKIKPSFRKNGESQKMKQGAMIFLSILILIVAIALPSINQNIRSILYVRISSIIFIYAGALAFNAFYIQSIGSGIGIYSGLFQVTTISQL